MANPQKAKGSAFERLVRDYLNEVVPCERIPPGATLDRGGSLDTARCYPMQEPSHPVAWCMA